MIRAPRSGPRPAGPHPGPLRVVAVGAVPPPVLERAAAIAHEVTGFAVRPSADPLDPAPFLDPARRQYRADLLLASLRGMAAGDERVLGVTALDLCLPVLTYVFGFAELSGIAATVSVHRLDPRFDGRGEDPGLMLERLEKETLHELGHLLGLTHCSDRRCVMASAHDTGEIDLEDPSYCRACRERLLGP